MDQEIKEMLDFLGSFNTDIPEVNAMALKLHGEINAILADDALSDDEKSAKIMDATVCELEAVIGGEPIE